MFGLRVKYFPLPGFLKQGRELNSERCSKIYLKWQGKYVNSIGLLSENFICMPSLCIWSMCLCCNIIWLNISRTIPSD